VGEAFGPLLLSLRRAAGLTQAELAEASGVSARAISDMELGRSRSPQRRTVAALVRALGAGEGDAERLSAAARGGRRGDAGVPLGLCELPRPVFEFVGRERELARIVAVSRSSGGGEARPVVVVHGTGGAGKSALVTRAAEVLRDDFPGGRLYVDLRGLDERPRPAGEALAMVLGALGTSGPALAGSDEERAAQLREVLGSRRVLLVLDNVAFERQIRPLLAGGAGLTLVTGRRALGGLDGVTRIALGSLPAEESARLLLSVSGPVSATTPDAATVEVARLCGHLPLALRIAGARLASRPAWTMGQLRDRLANADRRLAALTAGDAGVEQAFALSYAQLSPAAAVTFRRLALIPGASFSAYAASVACGGDLDAAEADLDELVEDGLLDEVGGGRYRFHDLVRLYARHQLASDEAAGEVAAASSRTTDWFLHSAIQAGRWFEPGRRPSVGESDALPGFDSADAARAWLDVERESWLPALRAAAGAGRHQLVVDVAEAMHWYSDLSIGARHWAEVFQLSRDCAARLADRGQEIDHLSYLSWALTVCAGRPEDGATAAMEAHDLALATGDRRRQAWALRYANDSWRRIGAYDKALTAAERAVDLFDQVDDDTGYVTMRVGLGLVLSSLERFEDALATFRSAVEALESRSVDPFQAELTTLTARTFAAQALGKLARWDEALREASGALREAQRLGSWGMTAANHTTIGQAHGNLGNVTEARDHLGRAVTLYDGMAGGRTRYHAAAAAVAALAALAEN